MFSILKCLGNHRHSQNRLVNNGILSLNGLILKNPGF